MGVKAIIGIDRFSGFLFVEAYLVLSFWFLCPCFSYTRKRCLQVVGLTIRSFTLYRFPIKKCWLIQAISLIQKIWLFIRGATRPVTSLKHQEGRRFFWEGPKCSELCPIVLHHFQYIFFQGGEKVCKRVFAPPGCGPGGDQLLEHRYVQAWIIAKSWKQSPVDWFLECSQPTKSFFLVLYFYVSQISL